MRMEHISIESMRAYLLGQLSDEEAAALEEEYFVNRAVFLKAQSAETELIAEYLDGSLPPSEKQCFEGRYLKVPELQRKIEEVKRLLETRHQAVQPRIRFSWPLAFATALVLILGTGIWVYQSRLRDYPHSTALGQNQANTQTQGQGHEAASGSNPGKPSVIGSLTAIYISPGLAKGPGSKPVQFEQPAADATIHLVLELPGQLSPIRNSVRITIVKPDESREPVWDRPDVLSESVDGGQALRLQLAGSLLEPGDYVIEASTPDGAIHETYVYRVTRPR